MRDQEARATNAESDVERLRARVAALADEWERDIKDPAYGGAGYAPFNKVMEYVTELRAALGEKP